MMLDTVRTQDGLSAAVPPLVLAGRPLIFVVGSTGGRGALTGLTLRWSLVREGAPFWDDELVAETRHVNELTISDPTSRSATELTLSIPTLPHWRGTLLVSLAPSPDTAPLSTTVLVVDEAEMDALSREVRQLTATDLPVSPTQGTEQFRVTDTLRRALRFAEEASELLGPRIVMLKNFRPHQQSLEVLAGWREPVYPVLVGSPERLMIDTVRVLDAIRSRLSRPSEGRPAYQVFIERRRPWLVVQFSFPIEEAEGELITAGLQQSLEERTSWQYRVFVREHRLYVFGRIGPFSARRPTGQQTLEDAEDAEA